MLQEDLGGLWRCASSARRGGSAGRDVSETDDLRPRTGEQPRPGAFLRSVPRSQLGQLQRDAHHRFETVSVGRFSTYEVAGPMT
jgi:hypothetical protein